MPTRKPPKPEPNQELTERRIAEFAVEESRLSNVAYRFQLVPRDRVWKNWDRTEFEPNHFQVVGLAGVCLMRDEVEKAQRIGLAGARGRGRDPLHGRGPGRLDRGARGDGDLEFVRTPDALRRDHGRQRGRPSIARSRPWTRPSRAIASPGRSCRRRNDDARRAPGRPDGRAAQGRHLQGGARPRVAPGPAGPGRRPRGRDADLEQLPGLRQPPARPRGAEEGGRPVGRGPRLRALHLRHAAAPQGARGRDLGLLRHRRHDPLHDLLGRQRGPLRRDPRRAGRALLRRAQPRLDHRRRAPVARRSGSGCRTTTRRPSRRCWRRTRPRASSS